MFSEVCVYNLYVYNHSDDWWEAKGASSQRGC